MSLVYYVIDVESSGLKPGWHEINQISIIRHSDKFQKTFNIKIEHPKRVSQEALNVQGKKLSDLLVGKSKEEVVETLNNFILEDGLTPDHRCFIGHNVSFDRNHLYALWEKVNKAFPVSLWLCTKEFSRRLAEKRGIVKPKLTLAACVQMAGLPEKFGAHSSTIDVQNTYELWQFLMTQNLNHISVIKNKPHNFDKAAIANYEF